MISKVLFVFICFSLIMVSYKNPAVAVTMQNEQAKSEARRAGNPVLQGWYADPDAHIFKNEYWIYPTYSASYDEQIFLDAFSSKDLVGWQRHPHVLDISDVRWAKRAIWAPSIVEKD